MRKKLLALLCCAAMLFGWVPIDVYAEAVPQYVTTEPAFTMYSVSAESEWIVATSVQEAWDRITDKSLYKNKDRLYVQESEAICYHYFDVDKDYFPNTMKGNVTTPGFYNGQHVTFTFPDATKSYKVWAIKHASIMVGADFIYKDVCDSHGTDYEVAAYYMPVDNRGNTIIDQGDLFPSQGSGHTAGGGYRLYTYWETALNGGYGFHGPDICSDGCTTYHMGNNSYVPVYKNAGDQSHTVQVYKFTAYNSNGNYSIVFDKNGPSGAQVIGQMPNQDLIIGQATALSKLAYECPGYAFAGWCTTRDGSGDTYMDEQELRILNNTSSSMTLYAQWRKIQALPANARWAIFNYTGSVQTWTAPADAAYKIEAWGAQGGNFSRFRGGLGAYTQIYVNLKKGQTLNIAVGGQNSTFNGGGKGFVSGGNGGGASSITIGTNRGELKNYFSYRDQIITVAGGGGGAARDDAYADARSSGYYNSDHGGGNAGAPNGYSGGGEGVGTGGTLTTAGVSSGSCKGNPGSFGQGGNGANPNDIEATAGGGGGYYGGGGGHPASNGGGGGGSSYNTSSLNYNGAYIYRAGTMLAGANSGHGKVQITPHACIIHFDPNKVPTTESVITGETEEQYCAPDTWVPISENGFSLKGYLFVE